MLLLYLMVGNGMKELLRQSVTLRSSCEENVHGAIALSWGELLSKAMASNIQQGCNFLICVMESQNVAHMNWTELYMGWIIIFTYLYLYRKQKCCMDQ